MKATRTVITCYIIGALCVFTSCYYLTWNTTQALWEQPNIYETTGPVERWPPPMQEKHKIIVYPYQQFGVILLVFGVSSFFFVPTVTALIISESR